MNTQTNWNPTIMRFNMKKTDRSSPFTAPLFVGEIVVMGDEDGAWLGVNVSPGLVGEIVGCIEGERVSPTRVGVLVGVFVGCKVGLRVGSFVGEVVSIDPFTIQTQAAPFPPSCGPPMNAVFASPLIETDCPK
jgi:hypothetical protein